jgi:hypothetical protein
MGRYNPSAPIILGNEWVGIRDENVQFSPIVNVAEQGHTFTTTSAYTLQDMAASTFAKCRPTW